MIVRGCVGFSLVFFDEIYKLQDMFADFCYPLNSLKKSTKQSQQYPKTIN